MWAQKNCQQSLKIALLRSVKCWEIIQERIQECTQKHRLILANDSSEQDGSATLPYLRGISMLHADVFLMA